MPSKYNQKQKKSITKQGGRYIPRAKPRCTNCGRECALSNPQFSKCFCGGTFQMYGVNNVQ